MQFWRFYLIGAWMYKFISLEESLSFSQTQRNFKILYKEVKKPEEFYNGANNTQPTKCWVAFG